MKKTALLLAISALLALCVSACAPGPAPGGASQSPDGASQTPDGASQTPDGASQSPSGTRSPAQGTLTRFVLYTAGGDGMTQTVYDLGAGGEGVKYVLFPQEEDWPGLEPFDYFTQPVEDLDSRLYTAQPVALDAAAWQQLEASLQENRFMELPATIEAPGADVPAIHILVEADGVTHIAGGQGAPHEDSDNGRRFKQVYDGFLSQLGA